MEAFFPVTPTQFVKAASALVEVIVDPSWTVEEIDEVAIKNQQAQSELHLQFIRPKVLKNKASPIQMADNSQDKV